MVILCQSDILLPRYAQKTSFKGFETVLWHLPFFFEHLVVILRQLDVRLPRYGRKSRFAGFETTFTVFYVKF